MEIELLQTSSMYSERQVSGRSNSRFTESLFCSRIIIECYYCVLVMGFFRHTYDINEFK